MCKRAVKFNPLSCFNFLAQNFLILQPTIARDFWTVSSWLMFFGNTFVCLSCLTRPITSQWPMNFISVTVFNVLLMNSPMLSLQEPTNQSALKWAIKLTRNHFSHCSTFIIVPLFLQFLYDCWWEDLERQTNVFSITLEFYSLDIQQFLHDTWLCFS